MDNQNLKNIIIRRVSGIFIFGFIWAASINVLPQMYFLKYTSRNKSLFLSFTDSSLLKSDEPNIIFSVHRGWHQIIFQQPIDFYQILQSTHLLAIQNPCHFILQHALEFKYILLIVNAHSRLPYSGQN